MTLSGQATRVVLATVTAYAAIFVAGIGSVVFAPAHSDVASWWPAAGISVVLLILSPRRSWLPLAAGIAVVSGLANVAGGRDLALSGCFGVANAAEAVVACAILRGRNDATPRLDRLEDFWRLLVAALAGAATLSVGAALAVVVLAEDSAFATMRSTFPSHAAAVLVIVPVALLWPLGHRRRPVTEYVLQVGGLAITTVLVFAPHQQTQLAFLTLPFLVWAALRLDARTMALEVLAVSISAVTLTSAGRGPFAAAIVADSLSATAAGALLQSYLVVAVGITLPLALEVEERRRLLQAVTASEKLTGATLDTTPSIIILTDLQGTVLNVNTATLTLSGFAEEELVGRPVWHRLVPERRIALAKSLFTPEGLATFPQVGEGPLATASGRVLQVLWSTRLVLDDRGRPTHAVMTGVDVTAERATSAQIRLLLEAGMTTAIVGVDAEGLITLVNVGAEAVLGRTADDLQGMPFTDLLDPEELAARTRDVEGATGFAALTARLSAGESRVTDWTWVAADGRRHIVSMSINGGGGRAGSQSGFLVVARDVTEAREDQLLLMTALEKERQVVERLRALDAAKNDFVSTVSHELRTPVTSIVGYTEILQDDDPLPSQVKMLEAIGRNGDRLIALCEDLLTLGALDAGAAAWDRAVVDLRDVLHGVEESVRSAYRGRSLEVTWSYPSDPVRVTGDHGQLERLALNLVGNAVKFTRDGGRVSISLEARDGEACLVVSDTGIGIPAAEQGQLFQKFFRSSTTQQLAIQGTGLGLSIVAGIVAAHGGRVSVDSTEGEGSTFTVRLPLRPS